MFGVVRRLCVVVYRLLVGVVVFRCLLLFVGCCALRVAGCLVCLVGCVALLFFYLLFLSCFSLWCVECRLFDRRWFWFCCCFLL